MKRKMTLRRGHPDDGFTLLEILIAFSIFSVMFLALMGGVASSYSNVMNSGDRTVAIKEAQIVLNTIRLARNQGTAVPAGIVAAFPVGALNPPRTALPNEVVTITYANTAVSPLTVSVRVQWSTAEGRIYSETLTSILSRT
jgi:prepilin-type N-terminal cleavage/methylation domain-containing protein